MSERTKHRGERDRSPLSASGPSQLLDRTEYRLTILGKLHPFRQPTCEDLVSCLTLVGLDTPVTRRNEFLKEAQVLVIVGLKDLADAGRLQPQR